MKQELLNSSNCFIWMPKYLLKEKNFFGDLKQEHVPPYAWAGPVAWQCEIKNLSNKVQECE